MSWLEGSAARWSEGVSAAWGPPSRRHHAKRPEWQPQKARCTAYSLRSAARGSTRAA